MSQYNIEMMHQPGELQNLQSMLLLSYAPLNYMYSHIQLEDYSLHIQNLDNWDTQEFQDE